MNSKKLIFYIILILVMFSPQATISADAGPKASMEFVLIQNGSQPKTEIISGILYTCDESDCKDAHIPEVIYGVNRELNCTEQSCYAVPSGKFYKLEITFSDGITRKSNIFSRHFYESKYEISINKDLLWVKELNGSNLQILVFGMFVFCPPVLALILIASFGVVVYTAIKKDKKNAVTAIFKKQLALITIVFFVIAGLTLNIKTFLITLLIESVIAFGYLKSIKMPYKETLMGVLLANVITQPIFVFFVNLWKISDLTYILMFELGIWIIESLILFRVSKQLSYKKILFLTFCLNAISYGVGLLLPI